MTTIRFNGHANVSIFTNDNKHILIDPFFTDNPLASGFDLKAIKPDVIVVTHGHFDHLGNTIEIAGLSGAMVVSNSEITKYLQIKGANAHSLQIGGGVTLPFAVIKFTPAVHGSSLPDGSSGGLAAGVLVFVDNLVIFHAGDTGLTREFRTIGETTPPAVALLPVGDKYTMGPKDAGIAASWLKAKRVIPIHYNTWEPIRQDEEFIRKEISQFAEVIFLKPGGEYKL